MEFDYDTSPSYVLRYPGKRWYQHDWIEIAYAGDRWRVWAPERGGGASVDFNSLLQQVHGVRNIVLLCTYSALFGRLECFATDARRVGERQVSVEIRGALRHWSSEPSGAVRDCYGRTTEGGEIVVQYELKDARNRSRLKEQHLTAPADLMAVLPQPGEKVTFIARVSQDRPAFRLCSIQTPSVKYVTADSWFTGEG